MLCSKPIYVIINWLCMLLPFMARQDHAIMMGETQAIIGQAQIEFYVACSVKALVFTYG